MQRFGAPAVTLGFRTVGVQTAINASAGMLRMPQRRFLPAVTLGAALWSLLYTTVGFTVVDAWLGGVSWWWAPLAVAAVVAIFVLSGRFGGPEAIVTSWAPMSTCWHPSTMGARPSGVPEPHASAW